jgi:outer membrane receptor protein involved in Fe transport
LTLENLGVSSTVPVESTQTFERGGPTYSLTWTAPQSPQLLTEAVVAYQDTFQNILPTTQGTRNACADFPYWRGWGQFNQAYCLESTQGFTSGSWYETSRDKRQRLTVSGKATWYKGRLWGANHRLQFGFIAENERYYREIQREPQIIDIDPYWAPAPPGAMCKDCPIPKANVTVRVSVPEGSTANATGSNWAIYAEDQIKPLDNLVITAGLRLDREEIDSEGRSPFDPSAELEHYNELVNNGLPFTNAFRRAFTGFSDIDTFRDGLAQVLNVDPDWLSLGPATVQSAFWDKKQHAEDIAIRNSNISPRLSVAWDPWGNGRSKLAASAGRYYDKIFLAVPLVELEPQWTNLVFDANGISSPVDITELLGSFNPMISTQQVDRELSTPYQDELTVGFEQAIATETTLRLTYINRQYRDQLQDYDINHVQGDKGLCVSASALGDAVVQPSEGAGAQIQDLYTGEIYTDTDPGPGDGRIDDCTGNVITALVDHRGLPVVLRPMPDGLADLYVQNPGWGEILLVGNFNSTDYRAFVVEVIRRMYRGWEMQASYTWSEATGDAEDFAQLLGNERNLLEDERGWLSYDQRHVAQISLTSVLPSGFRIGSRVRYDSGLPYSIQESRLTIFSSPPEFKSLARDRDVRFRWRYPSGQRNDQRNPAFWTVDLKLSKEFSFSPRHTLQISAEVFNLLNDDTIQLERRLDGASTGVQRFGRRWQIGLRLGF